MHSHVAPSNTAWYLKGGLRQSTLLFATHISRLSICLILAAASLQRDVSCTKFLRAVVNLKATS